MTDDARHMRRALSLARRGRRTAPNPMVGCVLVKGGAVVGEGWHRRFGGPHAEAEALARAGARARGAVAYVNLEPCHAHPGKKTPPCAPALAAAGVRRVVAALRDPHPGTAGRGLALLRNAGVKVTLGLLAEEAEALNRGFLWRMRHGRPYVILKAALSLDGKAYAEGGRSRWITGPAARAEAHRLRARCDAVLVGVGTVLADDPRLTAHGAGRDPIRVVLDTRLRTPRSAKVLPAWIVTASARALPGAALIRAPRGKDGVDLKSALRALAERGVGTVLVEGGPTVLRSFLRQGLADEAAYFLAPKLLAGAKDPGEAPRLLNARLRKVGADFLFYGPLACSRE